MIESILLAKNRKTGKDVILMGRDSGFMKQNEAYKNLDDSSGSEYETACIYELVQVKKLHRFPAKEKTNKSNNQKIKENEI